MTKLGQEASFGTEQFTRVLELFGGQAVPLHLFDSPLRRETLVLSQIDGAHSALAENFYYFVSTLEESIALKHNLRILVVISFTFAERGSSPDSPKLISVRGRVVAGRYRLERVLGEGAMGRVYLARDTKERGSVWAVKEVDYSALPIDEFAEARRAFQREALLLQGLRHPSLPLVVDHFQEEDRDYLVMERVEGPTLEELLKGRSQPLSEQRVVSVGLALAETLHYLHHRRPPVLYRDLKPANVMVALTGGIKLIDFGIARSAHPAKAGDTTAYGTPGFAPPEQYQGRTCPASDVYALGMTMLRASTLYDPPEFTFTHPAPSKLNIDLSPPFDSLVSSMVLKDPSERPHTSLVVTLLSAMAEASNSDPLRIWWRRSSRHFQKWWSRQILKP